MQPPRRTPNSVGCTPPQPIKTGRKRHSSGPFRMYGAPLKTRQSSATVRQKRLAHLHRVSDRRILSVYGSARIEDGSRVNVPRIGATTIALSVSRATQRRHWRDGWWLWARHSFVFVSLVC